jgi:hypothetical protein
MQICMFGQLWIALLQRRYLRAMGLYDAASQATEQHLAGAHVLILDPDRSRHFDDVRAAAGAQYEAFEFAPARDARHFFGPNQPSRAFYKVALLIVSNRK